MENQTIPLGSIKLLSLDAGNTLISRNYDLIQRQLAEKNVHISTANLRRIEAAVRPDIAKLVYEQKKSRNKKVKASLLEDVFTKLHKYLAYTGCSQAELAQHITEVFWPEESALELWSSLMPGVQEALDGFREAGLRMIVVSNSDGTVEDSLCTLGLRGYFEVVIDSDVVGFEKPDPRIFQHALSTTGSKPQEVLHVGDIFHADVLGARKAGIHALLLDPYSDWPSPDCPRLPDLLSLHALMYEN